MRHLQILTLTITALLTFATALAGTATAALPKNLPEKARSYTGVGGETKFETESATVVKLECKKSTGTGEEAATEASGKIHIEFKECEGTIGIVKSKCTGLGDTTAGVILVLGTGSLVFDKLSTNPAELKTAELFKLEPVHFECSSGAVLILVTGTELCLHLNPTQLSTKHEFHCVQEKGLNKEDAGWYNNAGELQTFGLKQSVNGATATPAAELGLSVVTTTEAVSADQ
jgi:hypothetical protein